MARCGTDARSAASLLRLRRPAASDAGAPTWEPRPCRVVPRGKSRIGPTRLKSAPTRPKSGRLGPYRPVSAETAESGRNSKKKKKKKVQTHHFTNLKTPRPLTFRPTLSNSLSHSVPHLPSLCASSLISLLCVSGSLCECSVLLQPSSVLSLLFS